MSKKRIALISALAVLVVIGGIFAGRGIARSLSAPATDTVEPTHSQEVQPSATPKAVTKYEVPTPMPSSAAAALSGGEQQSDGGATITEDVDGVVTIVPDWEAKAQYAEPVEKAPEANMDGSGGGKLDMQDGAYLGDHPDEQPAATPRPAITPTPVPAPAPTPVATPKPEATDPVEPQEPTEQTPATTPSPTPNQPSGGGSTPPDYEGSYDGEISPDGKYEYWAMFSEWVERGDGSQGIPGKGTHTEDGGDVVGQM